jgi:hypothetical protein
MFANKLYVVPRRKSCSTPAAHLVRLSIAMRFLSSIRIVRVALALVVALWMAGAGCMLGCENMVSASAMNEASSPANSVAIVADGEVCASMQSHDCCAEQRAKSAPKAAAKPNSRLTKSALGAQLDATSSTMRDCPLTMNATAALSKARPDTSKVVLAHTRTTAWLPNLQEQVTALSSPPLLPNRGHTYLRCCVFLI